MSDIKYLVAGIAPPNICYRIQHENNRDYTMTHRKKLLYILLNQTPKWVTVLTELIIQYILFEQYIPIERPLQKYTCNIINIIIVVGDVIISSEYDNTKMYVWSISNNKYLMILNKHTTPVSALAIINGKQIVSGSRDGTLCTWNIFTGKCNHVLKGHKEQISRIVVISGFIISGSYDNTLRIWSSTIGTCKYILQGHLSKIYDIAIIDSSHIVSASKDTTLRIWNIHNNKCVRILSGHAHSVRVVMMYNDNIISGSHDGSIHMWHTTTGECLQTFNTHTYSIYKIVTTGTYIITIDINGNMYIWNMLNNTNININYHYGKTSLCVVDNMYIVTSCILSLCMWNIINGSCVQKIKQPTYNIAICDGYLISSYHNLQLWKH